VVVKDFKVPRDKGGKFYAGEKRFVPRVDGERWIRDCGWCEDPEGNIPTGTPTPGVVRVRAANVVHGTKE
jgi:hypothetical protein